MATYGEVLSTLRDFRNSLAQELQAEQGNLFASPQTGGAMTPFSARGGISAFATALTNVHATGAGIRVTKGKLHLTDFVLKVYVYDKFDLGKLTPTLTQQFGNVPVDVEQLPIQLALAKQPVAGGPVYRQRQRPIVGGISIAPLNETYVGTLGCFLRRYTNGTEQLFALSNNHVMADTNRLPIGTPIVQPGPEVMPSAPGDVFSALSAFLPIQFSTSRTMPVTNLYDAAIALIADHTLVKTGRMSGITHYKPQLGSPIPGMRVTKAGRTTGVTSGTIIATRVNGVQVNYGTQVSPRLATFNDSITIVGDDGKPFSMPGDSGSVILEEQTGKPVALLFAGDGRTTTACDLGGVCQQFQAFPI